MATETLPAQPVPEPTFLYRVASIPLVKDSLAAVHASLQANTYTRTPYTHAQALTLSVLHYGEPLVAPLSPILVRADGFANKAVDVVEAKYPYPFKTPTENIFEDIKERRDHARDVAEKTIDERVKAPAVNVVQGIDKRFAPLVDYLASAVSRAHAPHADGQPNGEPSTPPKYQYQRAYALSIDLKDQIYDYSSEQLKQLHSQSVLIQRASVTAQNISTVASSSLDAAQTRVHTLSTKMLDELHKIQASTAALPAHLQSSFQPVQAGISSTIHDLSAVLTSEAPLQDKVTKVAATVRERVTPVLDAAADAVRTVVKRVEAGAKPTPANGSTETPQANGAH
ncbi:lipid droplet-associated perilipin protein [Amylostereum chailletii]|nr:lipid droplet-associated perilipin protein [Amylostereum chailletii]